MTPIDLGSYKSIYLQTAKEYIDKMSVSLEKLENNALDKEALNNLHIASHSLKSQSQVMGFIDIANICLDIEKRSDDALKGNSRLNNEIIANINTLVEEVKEILNSPKGTSLSGGGAVQNDTGAKI